MKKIYAAMTASACMIGSIAVMPQLIMPVSAVDVVYDSFEANYDGWHGNSDTVQLIAENGAGYSSSRGMNVTGRLSKDDGASSSKGLYLNGGVKYNYSIRVYSETDEKFNLTLLCVDENTGEQTEKKLVSKKTKAGEWT